MKRITLALLGLAALGLIAGCQTKPNSPDINASLALQPLNSSNTVADQFKVFLAGAELDDAAETITLPIFKGQFNGQDAWYIITESSNREDAERRGVNFSPKLANALGTVAVQTVTMSGGMVQFAGTVNFAPNRVVVPGPTGFPPADAQPGAIGDANYSPLITTGDGIVLNAPQIANASGLQDRVISIDFVNRRVTMHATAGLYHGTETRYISTESTDPGVAAIEAATFAPNLNAAPGLGSNDPLSSARSSIIPFINGQTGANNPERQGLMSALLGEGSPLNVTVIHPRNRGEIPTYSPLWDVHAAVWTDAAIAAGKRVRLDHHDDIARAVEEGWIVSAGAGPANPDLGGLRALEVIVNCPIMALR